MKMFGYALTLTLLSTQAFSGTILSDLSRTKSEANSSPIAVAYSNRNSVNLTFAHTSADAKLSSFKIFDETSNATEISLFTSVEKAHMEFVLSMSNTNLDYVAATTSDVDANNYDLSATYSMHFTETFAAGLTLSAVHNSSLTGVTKTNSNIYEITPGVGFKFQPNMALGFGVHQKFDKQKVSTTGGTITELPALATSELFVGVAYGVDQKISQDGLGVEAVVLHKPKAKKTQGAYTLAEGATTSFLVDGNYTLSQLDLGFDVNYVTGDNYNKTLSTKVQAYNVKAEYMIAGPFYMAPQAGYLNVENTTTLVTTTNDTTKGWVYGLGAGMRQNQLDAELVYVHGSLDSKAGTSLVDLNTNTISGRVSFYF